MLIPLLIADILMVGQFIRSYHLLPPEIPLYKGNAWGTAQLAPWYMIFLLPILMHCFFSINRVISRVVFPQDRVIYRIVQITDVIVILVCTVAFIRILRTIT